MAEYIEREALTLLAYKSGDYGHPAVVDLEDIADIPAADVVPVVHGRWDRTNRFGEFDRYNAHCTNCGYEIGAIGWPCEWKLPYCPNCGARMDGK